MTEPATEKPPAVLVKAEVNSRLEALCFEYRELAPAVKEDTARLKEVTDAIKVELTNAAPGSEDIYLHTPVLEKPLRLVARPGRWGINTKRMKAEAPDVYVEWAEQGAGTWALEQSK